LGQRDWGLLLLLSVLWGGSFFFVELVLAAGMAPLTVVWLRVGLGAGVLALTLAATGLPVPRGAAVWRALVVMGLLNNALPFTLFALAQGQIGGGLAAILNAMTPILTVVVLAVFADERRPGFGRIAGVVCGFAGVLVMMGGGATEGAIWAKLACLGAACSYALASVWGRRFRVLGVAPLSVAFGQCLCATGLLILPVMMTGGVQTGSGGVEVWLAVAGLAVLSTALAYVIFFRLLATVGSLNVGLVTFLVPVSAVALGVVFLGERLAAAQIAGAGLIALGLVAIDGRAGAWLWRRIST
jgi:drug/metabolite transporter (DMT)-like permease